MLPAISKCFTCLCTNDSNAEPSSVSVSSSSLNTVQEQQGAQERFFQAISDRKITRCAQVGTYISQGVSLEGSRFISREHENVLPLHLAILSHDIQALKALLEAGAKPDSVGSGGVTALDQIFRSLRRISRQNDGALPRQSINTALVMMKLLRQYGALAHTVRTGNAGAALMEAVTLDVRLVKELLAMKANVNARNLLLETPLGIACTQPRLEIIQALINAGANVNARAMGQRKTPLHLVTEFSVEEISAVGIVKYLLKSGANPNEIDSRGRTPLHNAVKQHNFEIIQLLRCFGAKCRPDHQGIYPEHLFQQASQMSDESYRTLKGKLNSCLNGVPTLQEQSAMKVRSMIFKQNVLIDPSIDLLAYPDCLKKYLKLQS